MFVDLNIYQLILMCIKLYYDGSFSTADAQCFVFSWLQRYHSTFRNIFAYFFSRLCLYIWAHYFTTCRITVYCCFRSISRENNFICLSRL